MNLKQQIHSYTHSELFSRFINVFSVDVLVRGANFLFIFLFIRLMNKYEFGIYGYLYAFAMSASQILGFGFYVSLQKLYADIKTQKDKLSSMLFTLSTSLLIGVILSFAILFFTKGDVFFFGKMNSTSGMSSSLYEKYRVYVFVAIAAMLLSNYILNYFVSSVKIRHIQAFNIMRLVLENGICISILLFSKSGEGALIRLSSVYITELVLIAIFGVEIAKNCSLKFDFFYLRKALKIGLPIMATAIFGAFLNFGDKYYVMKCNGATIFASYSLAVQLATIILIVFQSFNFIWLPVILSEKDLGVVKRKMKKNTIMLFGVLSGLGIIIFFGAWILLVVGVFPDSYKDMLQVLPLLLFANVLSALTNFYTNMMIYFEKTYIQFIVNALTALFSFLLYNAFVLQWGFIGAGIVLVILNLFALVIYMWRSFAYINRNCK